MKPLLQGQVVAGTATVNCGWCYDEPRRSEDGRRGKNDFREKTQIEQKETMRTRPAAQQNQSHVFGQGQRCDDCSENAEKVNALPAHQLRTNYVPTTTLYDAWPLRAESLTKNSSFS